MRPWPSLGYDRDRIAMHMLSVEAFGVAESELRRAVWLNPFEWRFKFHLAWCLFREKKYEEARDWAKRTLEERPSESECLDLLRTIEGTLDKERCP